MSDGTVHTESVTILDPTLVLILWMIHTNVSPLQ